MMLRITPVGMTECSLGLVANNRCVSSQKARWAGIDLFFAERPDKMLPSARPAPYYIGREPEKVCA